MKLTIEYKEIIKEEIKKCILSSDYFCKKYCYILHQKRGKILFELYPFQEKVLQDFQSHNKIIILKARQLGISTLSAAFCLWYALFNEGKNILFVSKRQKDAIGLIDKVRVMHQNLPVWLKSFAKTVDYNKQTISFTNDSKISAESTTEDTGRSTSNAIVICDEFAFVAYQEKLLTSVQQSAQTGKVFVISTPNGVGNKFHKMWIDATAGHNLYYPIRLKWDIHPNHDQKWRDEQTQELGYRLANQECDCDFLSSGNSVIDPQIIDRLKKTTIREPIKKVGHNNDLWIWELPLPGRDYLISADVSRGNGKDYSACHVIDLESCEQVAEFKGMIGTRKYARMLFELGLEYNIALMIVENANIGWDVVQELIQLDYPHLYYTSKAMFGNPDTFLRKNLDVNDTSTVPGFTTSGRTRPLIVGKLEMYFSEDAILIHSSRLTAELDVFVWKGDRAEAQSGYNDDLTMALAIGLFVRDSFNRLNKQGLALTKSAIESIGSSIKSSISTNIQQEIKRQYTIPVSRKIPDQDIGWLINAPRLK